MQKINFILSFFLFFQLFFDFIDFAFAADIFSRNIAFIRRMSSSLLRFSLVIINTRTAHIKFETR